MRIGVVRMLPGLGDLLCAVPALRALRTAEPEAEVTLIGLPRGRWMHERFPSYIDHWSPCHTCPGLPESEPDAVAHERFLRTARAARYDLAVQMHGNGRVSNPFTASLGATSWGGLRPPGSHPSAALLDELDEGRHEIERCGDALRAVGIGIPDDDTALEFPTDEHDRAELQTLLGPDPPRSLAVVHPGASSAERRWPAASFATVVDHLSQQTERVVLTGSAAEFGVTETLAAQSTATPLSVAGRTTVGSLAALLAAARIVVSNDTGVAHLAGAVGTPSVTVFARSDRRRWRVRGEWHREVHGPHGGWPEPDAVVAAVDEVLAGVGR
jgi:ADP-heptose:LPS heptosyltransferase